MMKVFVIVVGGELDHCIKECISEVFPFETAHFTEAETQIIQHLHHFCHSPGATMDTFTQIKGDYAVVRCCTFPISFCTSCTVNLSGNFRLFAMLCSVSLASHMCVTKGMSATDVTVRVSVPIAILGFAIQF